MTPTTPDLLHTGPTGSDAPCVILAHGAGAAMDTPFMATIAEGLAGHGLGVARFEFPYMAQRRRDGSRRPPDRTPVLLDTWRAVIARVRAEVAPQRLVIGGKSMGGRMASLIAAAGEPVVDGLVVLGFPFHPAGRPEKLAGRVDHLSRLSVPTLLCQGERDALGDRATVEALAAAGGLSAAVRLHWLADGDHSLKPRRASGRSEAQNLTEAVAVMAAFVRGL